MEGSLILGLPQELRKIIHNQFVHDRICQKSCAVDRTPTQVVRAVQCRKCVNGDIEKLGCYIWAILDRSKDDINAKCLLPRFVPGLYNGLLRKVHDDLNVEYQRRLQVNAEIGAINAFIRRKNDDVCMKPKVVRKFVNIAEEIGGWNPEMSIEQVWEEILHS